MENSKCKQTADTTLHWLICIQNELVLEYYHISTLIMTIQVDFQETADKKKSNPKKRCKLCNA